MSTDFGHRFARYAIERAYGPGLWESWTPEQQDEAAEAAEPFQPILEALAAKCAAWLEEARP